ncbi:CopG family ribbon-helix-helix protein [Pseudomonas sp. NPDC087358]|uniref:CopG family ribbon-helix-helix protein n=1 Tax=Pseudomonas sp. NPDC087358 TaxID=3364439 RepID=UPI00384ED9F8
MSESRSVPKFVVRLPDDLRDRIDDAACAADCSMNTIFVRAVRQYLDGQQRQDLLLDALARASGANEMTAHVCS